MKLHKVRSSNSIKTIIVEDRGRTFENLEYIFEDNYKTYYKGMAQPGTSYFRESDAILKLRPDNSKAWSPKGNYRVDIDRCQGGEIAITLMGNAPIIEEVILNLKRNERFWNSNKEIEFEKKHLLLYRTIISRKSIKDYFLIINKIFSA